MTPRPLAKTFVETFEDTRIHQRESRKAWLRRQLKARVRRFVEEFRTDFDGSRRPSVWSPRTGSRHESP